MQLPIKTRLRDAIVQTEARVRERLAARRNTAPPPAVKVYPRVDAHDHASMLRRHTHFIGWLEAQRLEVEQRLAGRALQRDMEDGV